MTSVKTDRSSPDASLEAALAALDQTDTAAAAELRFLDEALKAWSDDARLWHVHGLLLRKLDRRAEALQSLERATRLAVNTPIIAHGYARTLFEAGLPSVDAYGKALALAPGDPDIILGTASALLAEGKGEAAMVGLKQILRRSPQWMDGQQLLSDLRWANGERHGFTSNFDDALIEHPQDLSLWRAQITSLLHAEYWEDLLAAVARGRAAMGDHDLFDVNEAVALDELGEYGRAQSLFARFHHVEDPAVHLRWVRHLLRSGHPDRASLEIDKWLGQPQARMFWPYASIAWRLTGDPRWSWLEGDERFVGIYDIADSLPPLDHVADTLRALHKARSEPLEQSVRGGTQTDGNIFQHIDPVLVALREAVRASVADHVSRLPPPDPTHPLLGPSRSPIDFSGAWSVRLRSGGHHSNHVHPMGWLSSALYISLPPTGTGRAGWLTMGKPQAQLGIDLSPTREVEPKPGRLVLFPSTMWHGTNPFDDGERLTVAFDVALQP